MKLYWNPFTSYSIVHKNIYYCVRLLIRYGIHFRPFPKVIHHDENISASGIADRKRPCYERCARVKLFKLSSISSYGTFRCNTLATACYPICYYLLTSNPIKTVFYYFQCLCHPKVFSAISIVELV